MKILGTGVVALGLFAGLAGCSSDRPDDYARQRPSMDSLDEGDRGLQSKDVRTAADQMARDLLALPELRGSDYKWTIVVDRFEDRTMDRSFAVNYDIFTEALRVRLAQHGRGSVRLIENRARQQQLQSRELDFERDDFQQGSPGRATSTNPDFALYGKAMDMPNRRTNFYLLEFVLTDLRTREQVWVNSYEVRVAR